MSATDRTWIPLARFVPTWPAGLPEPPALDDVGVVDFEVGAQEGALTVSATLAFAADLAFALPGVEGLELLLLSAGADTRLTVAAVLGPDLTVSLRDLRAGVRFPAGLLRPVARDGPMAPWEPVVAGDGSTPPLVATFEVDQVLVDAQGRTGLDPPPALHLDPVMVGDTGIVVETHGLTVVLSDESPPPAGQQSGFRGLAIDAATVHLPPTFAVNLAPDSITATGLVIGSSGLSGTLTGAWAPTWSGTTPSGEGAGTLAGFGFALESLSIEFAANSIVGAALAGRLAVPFFDQVLEVEVSLAVDGAIALMVRATEDAGSLATLALPGLGRLTVTALGLVGDDAGDGLLLSGDLQPEVGAPALRWPTLSLDAMRIGSDGTVQVAGGWLTLQSPLALDLYGFGMEVTRIGFGTEDDGRRWFGVDGGIRLTELLPAGASARGLRVMWDPARPELPAALSLDGIGVSFGIPDVFAFEGDVALTDDPTSGAKLFTGTLSLGLDALDIGIDAGIVVGRDLSVGAGTTYVFVHLGVDVPIPVAATGTALYGLEGMFAMNMSPTVTHHKVELDASTTIARGDWYGWYKSIPDRFSVTDPFKWSPDAGAWAFGAGLSLGTLPDAGFSVNAKALLVVLLPGPVILLQGTADIFKPPAAFGGGSSEEGTLGLLAALDGRAGTLALGIDAAWSVPKLLDIGASTEAFFDFDRLDAWHLWVGRDTPASQRIRADVLSLFHADTWLMLDANGVGTGLGVSWGDSWRFGPAQLTLSAFIEGTASLSVRPSQLAGGLSLGGEAAVAVGPFGVGIGVRADLEGNSFAPYRVAGTLAVSVGLPTPLKDLDVAIGLEWSQPATPMIDDPFESALVTHEGVTESWSPTLGGDTSTDPDPATPVVPLDAGVQVSFTTAMGDESGRTDNPPVLPPLTVIGEHVASYAVTDLRLHQWRRSHPRGGWQDVTDTVVATWTPDAGAAGSRLQCNVRSPFAFTRSTSRRWVDSFLEAHPRWPCPQPPPAVRTCLDWQEHAVDSVLPRLWEQGGALLSSEATLRVTDTAGGRAVRLGPSTAPQGMRQPGLLWVGLPELVAELTAGVDVPEGDWVVLRGWAGQQQVAVAWGLPGAQTLRVSGAGMDAVTLGWGLNVEPDLHNLCWVTQSQADVQDAWEAAASGVDAAVTRWASEEPVFEPESHYLLQVTTRALLTKGGSDVQRTETRHAMGFQTGGPPGIVPTWVWAPQLEPVAGAGGGFPYGGVLRDLSAYVSRSIPEPRAAAVFRGYDLGCEFGGSCVQQLYGADMAIRVRDHDGRPALDSAGTPIVATNAWALAPTTTLTTSELAWLYRLDACTGAIDWLALVGDEQIRAVMPGLLHDDFSGVIAAGWTAHVLDPAETRGSGWDVADGVLLQDVDIAGGDAAPASPDKPGTCIVADDVAVADVAVETLAWASTGAFGIVFRWQGPADYYRFSVGRQRLRLARVVRGGVRELWVSPGSFEAGTPTLLAVQTEGVRIRCQVGERLVCDLEEADAGVPPSGSVGLYTWGTADVRFDQVRARPWPGAALAPERPLTAELEASRPVFTDHFDDLAAFDQVVLGTGAAASSSSASGGIAWIARATKDDTLVAALAGDAAATDYVVECTTRPEGVGSFGLLARHTGPGAYLALTLTPGVGRSLTACEGGTGRGLVKARLLWSDDGEVEVGAEYALGLRCEGNRVTATIDELVVAGTTSLVGGRFGLLSAIAEPGCAVTNLVVRSAPRAAVHHWDFTTSRHVGLPDLLDTYVGHTWPVETLGLDLSALRAQTAAAGPRLTTAVAARDAARTALAAAVTAGDAGELPWLQGAALDASAWLASESSAVHDLLAGALATARRPTPPVVEVCTVEAGGGVVALLLDLPEPLPWERVSWTLRAAGEVDDVAAEVVLAWSRDGTRAIVMLPDASAYAAGEWTCELALHLDVGAERPVWRRAGSSAPEAGRLRLSI